MEEAWELAALMPTILRWKGYKFFFYSDEEDRPHIHVKKQNGQAKYWLEIVEFVKAEGFSQKELNVIKKKIIEQQDLLLEEWNAYFNT